MPATIHYEFRTLHGVLNREWGIRGDAEKGFGTRQNARRWKRGVSGKQNKDINRPKQPSDDLVSCQSFDFYLFIFVPRGMKGTFPFRMHERLDNPKALFRLDPF